MKLHETLIKAAVITAYQSGISLESAQVQCLLALNKVAASSGPKTLQRLIAEHSSQLVAGRVDPFFEITGPSKDQEIYIAVPESLIRSASDWLMSGDAEERRCGSALWRASKGAL